MVKTSQTREKTNEMITKWWHGENTERPIVNIIGKRKEIQLPKQPETLQEYYIDAQYRYARVKAESESVTYYGEALPYVNLDLGPGSVAAYLGCEPRFMPDTVWYRPMVKDGELSKLKKLEFDPDNIWWREHFGQMKKLKELIGEEPYLPTIPDLMNGLDVLSSVCEPQDLCFLLMDEPELVKERVAQIDDAFMAYYNACYDLVKEKDGASAYTSFRLWSPGRTEKVQCDFGAFLSPAQYEEFAVPSIEKEIAGVDYSMYHLDGSCNARHVDMIAQFKKLKALQYTPDVGYPDGPSREWFPVYDKLRAAGKSLWFDFLQGGLEDWIRKSEELVERYGCAGLYFLYPPMDDESAKRLYDAAEHGFKRKF